MQKFKPGANAKTNSPTYAALAATALWHATTQIGRMRRFLAVPDGALLVGEHHQIDVLQLLLNGATRRVQAPADQLSSTALDVILELDARQPGECVDIDGSGELSGHYQ